MIFLLSLINLIILSFAIEIKDLASKSDFEDVIFKSDKEWLVVIYAKWDRNQAIWKDLWEYVKLDFEKDEIDIEMARFDIANEHDKVPDMNLLRKYIFD